MSQSIIVIIGTAATAILGYLTFRLKAHETYVGQLEKRIEAMGDRETILINRVSDIEVDVLKCHEERRGLMKDLTKLTFKIEFLRRRYHNVRNLFIKWIGKKEGILDITPEAIIDEIAAIDLEYTNKLKELDAE